MNWSKLKEDWGIIATFVSLGWAIAFALASFWVDSKIDAKVSALGHATTKTDIAVANTKIEGLEEDVREGFKEATEERRHIIDLLLERPR